MGCTKVSHPLYALSTDIQRDCPHLPYLKPKKPSKNMHLILKDRHLGGKLHPHWKWVYAVPLTKSFLSRKSQANYLEHYSQIFQQWHKDSHSWGSECCIFLLLWALHHYCSYTEWGPQPSQPKILNGYSQVSHIQGHPKCLRKHEPQQAQQDLQATFRANFLQKEHTVRQQVSTKNLKSSCFPGWANNH